VTSRYGDAAQERGGRPRRLFVAKAIAVQAVKAALGRIEALTRDLKHVLES
jgi:hypothetical protein